MQNRIRIDVQDGSSLPAVIVEPTNGDSRGTVLLAHGIFSDKDEHGRFVRQADMLKDMGLRSVRFDFRGHGEHETPSEQITVSGMLLDFDAAVNYVAGYNGPLFLVASSFGGSLSLLHLLTWPQVQFDRWVLLNPVVDYRRTFIDPIGPDLKETFGPPQWEQLSKTGKLTIPSGVTLSAQFILDMKVLRPYDGFDLVASPTCVVHGTADRSVPYEVTMAYAFRSRHVTLRLVDGADHAFAEPWEENETFGIIRSWLKS